MNNKAPTAQRIHELDYVQIALCIDNNYVYPTSVLLQSLIDHRKPTTYYDIFVLVDSSFSDSNKSILETLCNESAGTSLEFITTENDYSDADLVIDHITKATFFRLELPKLLPHCDKCLYLDSDILICDDLYELFSTDLDDDYIGGVLAFAYYRNEQAIESKIEELQLRSLDNYINAGVLLLNLKRLREDNMAKVFEQHLARGYSSQDQDVLNAACSKNIKLLPFKYNAMTKYELLDDSCYESSYLQGLITQEEWNEGRLTPSIIHYADKRKPWNDLSTYYADRWWATVARLPRNLQIDIFEEYIQKDIESALVQRAQLARTLQRARDAESQRNKAREENRRLKESHAWKIGRAATAPSRVIRKLLNKQ